jgi:hypothetical protein
MHALAWMEEPEGKKRKVEHVLVRPWTKDEECTLLHVPHDVVRAHIAPLLSWADLDCLAACCRQLSEDARHGQGLLARKCYPHEPSPEDARQACLFVVASRA